MATLECDYLVIGAGAMGMAFTDELLTRDKSCSVLLVEKRGQPGGHWADAYPFVRLHQPSHFYGVASTKLERSPARRDGDNELAGKNDILAYFQQVLEKWQATGRLAFMAKCEVSGAGDSVASLVEPGKSWKVSVRRKVVDAAYMKVEIPATHTPPFTVAADAKLIPLGQLPSISEPFEDYVVIGAGKTGIDAVVWLLRAGVAPARVRWVVPRDPWLWNRANIQPGLVLEKSQGTLDVVPGTPQSEESLRKIAEERERVGSLWRIDEKVWPEAFQCATVDLSELEDLRKIKDNIIRLGHVLEVGGTSLVLEQGSVATTAGTLHVDCSADGLSRRPSVPIWQQGKIVLQPVVMCQQVTSAALLAYVEASWPEREAAKNELLRPTPHPTVFKDWLELTEIQDQNFQRLAQAGLGSWFRSSRLSILFHESTWTYAKFVVGRLWKEFGARRAKL